MRNDLLITQFIELADSHCSQNNADTFCVFLKIHACVCDKVTTGGHTEVLKLNRLFIQKCTEVYDRFQQGPIDPLPTAWIIALYAYTESPSNYPLVLPLMVVAHIIEDLGSVLCDVEIEKEDYDAVFEHIIACIEQVRLSSDYLPQGLKQLILDALANDLFPSLRNRTVESLRNRAWAVGQRRKRLRKRINLARWVQSGWPRVWVQRQAGEWTHDEWLVFFGDLKGSEYWPVDPDEVGLVLEQLKRKLYPR